MRGLRSLLLGFVLLGCLHVTAAWSAAEPRKTIAFTDAFGNRIEIASPVKRIVVINGDAAEILCALGAEANIVGISSHMAANDVDLLSGLQGRPVVGSAMSPSIEKIIELQPDLVIAYEMWMTEDAFEGKLAPLGIAVARMYCYRIARLDEEVRILGRLVGRESEAEAYIQHMHQILDTVAVRLQGIQTRTRIYNESYGAYKTVSDNSGADILLELAGVENIAAGQPVPWPEVSAEWVVEKDPEVIVKVASATFVKTGFGITDVQEIDAFRNDLISRPAWSHIEAVKKGRVHILSSELWVGPRAPLGMLYIARWAYPERFRDIDPEELHRQWLMKWHHKKLEGVYVYP